MWQRVTGQSCPPEEGLLQQAFSRGSWGEAQAWCFGAWGTEGSPHRSGKALSVLPPGMRLRAIWCLPGLHSGITRGGRPQLQGPGRVLPAGSMAGTVTGATLRGSGRPQAGQRAGTWLELILALQALRTS